MARKSWLYIGPMAMQICGAGQTQGDHFSGSIPFPEEEELDTWPSLFSALVMVGIPMLLILLQPDFGTAMVLCGDRLWNALHGRSKAPTPCHSRCHWHLCGFCLWVISSF